MISFPLLTYAIIIDKRKIVRYSNISLLVSSCDNYRSVLEKFYNCFFAYFNGFDGNIYTTASGNMEYDKHTIIGIDRRKSNLSFSTRLLLALKNIKTKYVLFFLDDFLVYKKIDPRIIESAYNAMEKNKRIGMSILHDNCSHVSFCDKQYNEYFYIKRQCAPYKCTTQAALWRRSFLIQTLRKGESAWEFELIGSYRLVHNKKIILYRNDSYNECISYPRGGIIWRGAIKIEYQKYYSFNIDDIKIKTTVGDKKNSKHTFIDKVFHKSYPFLSRFFKHIHRIGSGIPDYVAKINDVSNSIFLD